jgi:hypothetical protein
MKDLQQLCPALILTLILALSAFAGEMTTMIAPPAPPASEATEIGLNLLQSVLLLF